MNSLDGIAARRVLAAIEERSASWDPRAKERVRAAQAVSGIPLPLAEREALYAGAPLRIDRVVGRLLYALVRARRPRLAFEFGASFGYSTLHIAAALQDGAAGRLVTTEKDGAKAAEAQRNLAAAGLGHRVEVHAEDALATVPRLDGAVEFAFLDGWNDLYLDVLRALEPRLAPHAVVVADYSADDPVLAPFTDYVLDPAHGYATTLLPLSDGVAIAVREP